MNTEDILFSKQLGNDRTISVLKNEESFLVQIYEEETNGEPNSTKCQTLTPSRWRIFNDNVDEVTSALEKIVRGEDIDHKTHLGGNVFLSVKSPYRCVNVRKFENGQYENNRDNVYATKFGVSLKSMQWNNLKGILDEVNFHLPEELESIVPCYLSADHANQVGYLQCSECNPSGNSSMNF